MDLVVLFMEKYQMSVFRFELCIATESNEAAWVISAKIEKIMQDSLVQLNSLTLQRDGKDFPKSQREQLQKEIQELNAKERDLDYQIALVNVKLEKLLIERHRLQKTLEKY